jgi:osmoprotectant transport system substrate-binding protein
MRWARLLAMVGARSARAALLAVALVLSACGVDAAPASIQNRVLDDDAITVGSFDFDESELLAELYAVALERAGFDVDREFRIGPRELVEPALQRGLIELLPEYGGSALDFVTGEQVATADANATHEALVEAMQGRGLVALEASSAQDRNGFAVTRETAERLDVRTVGDLAPFADRMRFGGPAECPERPLCLVGLRELYGLEFGGFVPLDASGPLTLAALTGGDVEVALVFTTAPLLLDEDVVLLVDELGLQPAENVTPVVHGSVLERFGPELADTVNAVSRRLTTEELRRMNGEVQDGRPVRAVVADWLDRHLPDDAG